MRIWKSASRLSAWRLANGMRFLSTAGRLSVGILAILLCRAAGQALLENPAPAIFPPPKAGLEPVAFPNLDSLESSVAEQIRSVQGSVLTQANIPGVSDGDLAEGYGMLGHLYHAYQLSGPARSCYRNASRLAPGDYRWPHLLGQLTHQAGRLEEAASHYDSARKLNATYVATAVHLGSVYAQLNRLEEARWQFRSALALDPVSAAARNGLGELALSAKRYREAIDHFQAVLKRVPEANRIHYSLAMALREAGELEQARRHLALRGPVGIRAEDPLVDQLGELRRRERVHLLEGRLAFGAGRFREAARAFAKAVKADPKSARARVNLGTALARAGDTVAAMEHYRAALRLEPQHTTVHFNLGMLTAREGDHAGASEHFQLLLKSVPEDVDAHRWLARSLLELGRDQGAFLHWLRAVKLAPDDELLLMELAEALAGRGLFHEARDQLERAHRRFPHCVRTASALARILAACPDRGLRDGTKALKLAKLVYQSTKLLAHGETVALAELERCEEAAQWQSHLIAAAERDKAAELAARLRRELARYRRGSPCASAAPAVSKNSIGL